jgi:hypothetical protein
LFNRVAILDVLNKRFYKIRLLKSFPSRKSRGGAVRLRYVKERKIIWEGENSLAFEHRIVDMQLSEETSSKPAKSMTSALTGFLSSILLKLRKRKNFHSSISFW